MPKPTFIIHGGAGALTPENMPPKLWANYSAILHRIYRSTAALLEKGGTALDAATHAVVMMEDCPLFNCGKGAVFTRDGTVEMEASVMTTRPYHKRATSTFLLSHVKNPIKLAREMLIRGDHDLSHPSPKTGTQGHCCIAGDTAEKLAREWGLEIVDAHYFWTRKRWEQHKRGLENDKGGDHSWPHDPEKASAPLSDLSDQDKFPLDTDEPGWDGVEYIPQGTVGCVAMDSTGAICTATSTGGLTNKLAGRIGDTPSIGAGFWAEEWSEEKPLPPSPSPTLLSYLPKSLSTLTSTLISNCLPNISPSQSYTPLPPTLPTQTQSQKHALALSGTGNGDSFLRLCAAHTVSSIVRFSSLTPPRTLASAVTQIVGPGGEMQQSAGKRWGRTGEGEGGMIGIEYVSADTGSTFLGCTSGSDGGAEHGDRKGGGEAKVVFDFNCGGLVRCWKDESGRVRAEWD